MLPRRPRLRRRCSTSLLLPLLHRCCSLQCFFSATSAEAWPPRASAGASGGDQLRASSDPGGGRALWLQHLPPAGACWWGPWGTSQELSARIERGGARETRASDPRRCRRDSSARYNGAAASIPASEHGTRPSSRATRRLVERGCFCKTIGLQKAQNRLELIKDQTVHN